MIILNSKLSFPSVSTADEDGIVAIGGDLSVDRLLLAYRSGIFPWYDDDQPIIWWSPDPRFVLFPEKLKVSKSMQAVIKSNQFTFTINRAFTRVIQQCKNIGRKEQDGTWITDEVEKAYTALYRKGFAHSAEAWLNDELAGGLYGVRIGKVFFGESMFCKVTNASKFAFIQLVKQLQSDGVALIDCQVYTAHLESLGAEMIDRKNFIQCLSEYC
jgi:leucyl/phenylalanyl-tRNA---protein transferase